MQHTKPGPSGLYDPRFEHDACGVSFVANIKGLSSRAIVTMGISALCNMEHRGATGTEPDTGDGAGILIQVPDRFLREVVDFELPAPNSYAVGLTFLPADEGSAEKAIASIEAVLEDEGLQVLGWRAVPIRPDCLGASSRAVMPTFKQLFVAAKVGRAAGIDLDRIVFIARKRIEHELPPEQSTYFVSFSSRTLIYKGMFTTPQLAGFFPDLEDEAWRALSPWCTAASAPTPSPRGRWLTPTGSSPTTAKSTRCKATATGCAPAKLCLNQASSTA